MTRVQPHTFNYAVQLKLATAQGQSLSHLISSTYIAVSTATFVPARCASSSYLKAFCSVKVDVYFLSIHVRHTVDNLYYVPIVNAVIYPNYLYVV